VTRIGVQDPERDELFGLKLGPVSPAAKQTWVSIPALPDWTENKPWSLPDVERTAPAVSLGRAARRALDQPVGEHVGTQPSAVSQHRAELRLGHLVRTRREGTHVFNLAQNDHVRHIVEEALFHADHVVQGPADHDEPQTAQPTTGRKPA